MSYGMGLTLQKRYDDFLPNARKCLTWQDVKASHAAEDNQVVIKMDKVYGMLIILFVGLSGAVLISILECLLKKLRFKKGSAGDLTVTPVGNRGDLGNVKDRHTSVSHVAPRV